jgi:glycosyltransferase involved in cell wall biosynthesis
MSNALLEAMVTGVPVIVSHIGGNKDVVVDQERGTPRCDGLAHLI